MREEGGRRQEVRQAISAAAAPLSDRRNLGWVVAAFLFGILIGVAGLLAYAWVKVPVG